jgi:hypothetical protein
VGYHSREKNSTLICIEVAGYFKERMGKEGRKKERN